MRILHRICQRCIVTALLPLLWLITGAATAQPALESPVICPEHLTCVVQNYFDHDHGADHRDFRCGTLSYDGHKGTDIRVATLSEMRAGAPVIAAAPGTVAAIRDGMDDVNVNDLPEGAIKGRSAGNVVMIDHGDGWRTIYGHLRKGSVAVSKGDRVNAGDYLGLIGMSGRAEFPHVHFEVRRGDVKVDPFVGKVTTDNCRKPTIAGLWTETALAHLDTRTTGRLSSGFTDRIPDLAAMMSGDNIVSEIGGDAEVLVYAVLLFGAEKGDRIRLMIYDEAGGVVSDDTRTIERNRATYMRFIGFKRSSKKWRTGEFTGRLEVTRDQETPIIAHTGDRVRVTP